MDQMVHLSRKDPDTGGQQFPDASTTKWIYEALPETSRARRWLLDNTLVYGQVHWFDGPPSEHSSAYLQDVVRDLIKLVNENRREKNRRELIRAIERTDYVYLEETNEWMKREDFGDMCFYYG